MTPQNNPSPVSSCLKTRLAETEAKARAAEFHKQTAAELSDLIKKKDKEIETYRSAYPGLIAQWKDQQEKFANMQAHLASCYPDWECILGLTACKEILCHNRQLKGSYEARMGEVELQLEYANADLAKAKDQLNAWKDMSKWITKRLDDNNKLFERICAVDSCKKPYMQLYLFHFVLWPSHRQLSTDPRKLQHQEVSPESAYCYGLGLTDHCTCLVGYPWIISVGAYDCHLANAWEAWRIAGERQGAAQSAFEQIARDKAEYQALSAPAALELAVEESLRNYDKLAEKPECPKCPPCEPPADDPCHQPCPPEDDDGEQPQDCGNGSSNNPCDQPPSPDPEPCEQPPADNCDDSGQEKPEKPDSPQQDKPSDPEQDTSDTSQQQGSH